MKLKREGLHRWRISAGGTKAKGTNIETISYMPVEGQVSLLEVTLFHEKRFFKNGLTKRKSER
jgi:hypothetical protein